MSEALDLIKKECIKNFKNTVALRRYLHAHPEVSKKEEKTGDFIFNYLKDLGLNPKRIDTGVFAEIVGKTSEKSILLRADIDALPIKELTCLEYKSENENVMHACGHDFNSASLLCACKVLVKHKNELNGTVKVVFQHAEELGYGATRFLESGLLGDVDTCFGSHLAPDLDSKKIALVKGANNASVDYIKIEIKGKKAHIASPEKGKNASVIASSIVVRLNEYSKYLKTQGIILGIGKIVSGDAYNVISDYALIEGTLRVFDQEKRDEIKNKIIEIVKDEEEDSSVFYDDFGSVLINQEKDTIDAINVAKTLFKETQIVTLREPSFTGDDMARFIDNFKGCYMYQGCQSEKVINSNEPLHSPYFNPDEEALKMQSVMYACVAYNFLTK